MPFVCVQPALSSWARKTGGRLRHLGARREQLLGEHVRCVQQIRDLLECVWPAALDAAKQPFKSTTWVAAMTVVMGRDGADLAGTRRLGRARFEHAVRKEVVDCAVYLGIRGHEPCATWVAQGWPDRWRHAMATHAPQREFGSSSPGHL